MIDQYKTWDHNKTLPRLHNMQVFIYDQFLLWTSVSTTIFWLPLISQLLFDKTHTDKNTHERNHLSLTCQKKKKKIKGLDLQHPVTWLSTRNPLPNQTSEMHTSCYIGQTLSHISQITFHKHIPRSVPISTLLLW